jgi:dolichol-phosphate mannosyltransferase
MRFLTVGISGLVVNMALLAVMTEFFGLHYMLSAVLATQGSTIWNFGLTEHWVFSDRQQARGRILRLVFFLCMNNAAFLLRGPMIYLLTDRLGMYYLLSNLISLVALTIVRYGVADNLIWKRNKHSGTHTAIFNYNIHGIITVQSDVGLPELEGFLTTTAADPPTIRVRIGTVGRPATTAGNARRIRYDEAIGALGFGAEITIGDTVDVVASSLLRHSPHVLYTNVVEPILRWTFVEKGYALVHGACIAVDEQAYLVTARTDTGKTTTMLRMLARQRRAVDRMSFLSDDLTLVSRDGAVLTYPKPLTISHHTVRAVNATFLSWRERLVLPFQSRIHSRSGRRFAFLLTQTRLPVATINAVVQWLVPPPKYHVQRLVPQVKVAREGKLAGMFIIERGDDRDVPLEAPEALEILMTNCEDAYGFPPYPVIKDFLHSRASCDLRQVEREIVSTALTNQPTMLLGSSKMDWAQRISSLIHARPIENGQLFAEHPVAVLTPNLTA